MIHHEMMQRMPISEFNYWAAYYSLQAEQTEAAVARSQPKRDQTPEEMLRFLDTLGAMNAKR